MSLYISRTFRQRELPEMVSTLPAGKVPVTDAFEARRIGAQLGLGDRVSDVNEPAPTAGEIAALALLDDSYQRILVDYLGQRDATLMNRILAVLRAQLGLQFVDRLLVEFAEEFLGARMAGLALLADSETDPGGVDLDRPRILQQILVFWLLVPRNG